jgi:predicted sulfurtransferase
MAFGLHKNRYDNSFAAHQPRACIGRLHIEMQCDELVTLGPRAEGRASASSAGIHLTPTEFHERLGAFDTEKPPVLLDVRNVYESEIGHFARV